MASDSRTELVSFKIDQLCFLYGYRSCIRDLANFIVSKEDLSSAIGLNSGVFNAARVLGPGMAGVLIAVVGTGGAFLLNGFSYIAVIFALIAMKINPVIKKQVIHPLLAIKEGLHYS